ncbi:hypothetical protein [Oceaniovalibus sp. ACAM 378]|uniref:hypothetical protein n=1 Tax=Oceaniovalibus sp. ACAM 378 TaxID=2599923 RepID=UPI00210841FE|nr:hypothetical protein [Oceaniovalibus sp. ACAM 378]
MKPEQGAETLFNTHVPMDATTQTQQGMRPMTKLAAFLLLALAACTPASRDDLTRAAAKTAIRPILADKLPGVPVEPAIDCVIDNANSNELLSLAADSVTGPTASTRQIVTTIVSRTGTIQCLATRGLPALLR